tara:strand:+ start:2450 stop:4207 length:1758 start_codon:yes stop_codon:yes gene_type:complete
MAGEVNQGRITRWLDEHQRGSSKRSTIVFSVYAMLAAFSTYFCMYAFRKPFAVAKYNGMDFFSTGLTLKSAFLISQIIGYTISKYLGCKYCSEISRSKQSKVLVAMIVVAELSLLAFAVLPENLKVLAIFVNGLPLGMVWGLVSRYLEGRKTAELLFAGLSCSYIVASSSVKTIGGWLMESGVPDFWMPVAIGAIFLLPYMVAVFFLNQLPLPSEEDETNRNKRTTMDSQDRMIFLKQFLLGMLMLMLLYFFLTAYRDFRDNYMPEIFAAMGYPPEPTLFSKADWPVAFGIMVVMALLGLVKNHRRGVMAVFVVMLSGMILMGGATLLRDVGALHGFFGEDVTLRNDDLTYTIRDEKGNKTFWIHRNTKEVIVENEPWHTLNDMDEGIQQKLQQLNSKASDRAGDSEVDLTLDDDDLTYTIRDEKGNKTFSIHRKTKEVIVDNKPWQTLDNMDEETQQRFRQLNSKASGGLWWMILIGFGAYLAYVPFGAVLFERIMASTKAAGTAVFAIYICDALGYTGSVGIQLYKDLGQAELDYFEFLRLFTYFMAILGTVLFILSAIYFYGKSKSHLLAGPTGLAPPAENN